MSRSLEKGEFLPAIIHYLKSVGVHVQHWKASPSQEKAVPALSKGVFGVPLHLLPLSEHAEGVPQFLVNACDLLRPHLHVEGLFRKCGSMTRIRALKTRLEAGENCLEMALPCDVATLLKQFLRELPEPLIPAELQGPLCDVQQREDCDLRGLLTFLLTCLFPPGSAHTLRYLFTFLQEVAARSTQNKMDLANLAVVFAPNLFLPGKLCRKLDSRAEEQLHRQAAVIQALIGQATEIGTVPRPLLGKVQAAFSDVESRQLSPSGSEDGKDTDAKARRRWRRRSVGDIVTEALSKLKTGRALCNSPCQEHKEGGSGEDSPPNSSLKASFNSKRKASDDSSCVLELSAKKRRSILDSASSDPFADAGDPLDQPAAAGPRSPAPVFSSPSKPVSDAGSRAASPRVQRQWSSFRKQPQRKRSFRATPGCSPAPFQQKDAGRKSFRMFFRSSKYAISPLEQPHPGSDSGWLLMKKAVMEAQRWAQLPASKPKESGTGTAGFLDSSPNPPPSEDSSAPTCRDREVPESLGNAQPGAGLSLYLDSITCLHQEPDPDVLLGSRGLRDTTEGLVVDGPPASPLRRHRALRRSLSWPEDLSMRDAAEQEETAFAEALIVPGGSESQMFSLAEPAQPDVEAIVAGLRQLRIPAVRGTPADSCRADGPLSEPSPLAPKPEPPEARLTLVNRLRHLNEVPKTGLKRLSLTFQRASPQASEGPVVARRSPPKRKGGRRFGRSVSHESSLPLQAQEEAPAGSAVKRGVPHKSPLQSFKACGQQIFLTRKHIALSFAGLRRKKEGLPTSVQNPEQSAAVSQEAVQEHPNLCSARFPRTEMQS